MTLEQEFINQRKRDIAKGIAQGIAQGIEQGIEQGIAQGRSEAEFSIAKKLLIKGMSVDFIAETTGLSIEEIQKIDVTE